MVVCCFVNQDVNSLSLDGNGNRNGNGNNMQNVQLLDNLCLERASVNSGLRKNISDTESVEPFESSSYDQGSVDFSSSNLLSDSSMKTVTAAPTVTPLNDASSQIDLMPSISTNRRNNYNSNLYNNNNNNNNSVDRNGNSVSWDGVGIKRSQSAIVTSNDECIPPHKRRKKLTNINDNGNSDENCDNTLPIVCIYIFSVLFSLCKDMI